MAQGYYFLSEYEKARDIILELGISNIIKNIHVTEQVSLLLCKQNDFHLAFEILYEFRRSNQISLFARNSLFARFVILYGNNFFLELQEIDSCIENTAVVVKFLKSGKTKTLIFEKREDSQEALNEYDLSSSEFEKVKNKKEGDEILWEVDPIGNKTIVRIEYVQSKFIYCYQKCNDYFEQSLEKEKPIYPFFVENMEDFHLRITQILESQKEANDIYKKFWGGYEKWELPIHSFKLFFSFCIFSSFKVSVISS